MSDDIEVTVTLTRDEADYVLKRSKTAAMGSLYPVESKVVDFLNGHRPAPSPPRSEYPLQHVSSTNGNTSVTDLGVSLVPAHSLRSGDEVEWAPGDWRAIEVTPGKSWVEVTVSEPKGGVDVAHVWEVAAFMLVAVRRSGVTG